MSINRPVVSIIAGAALGCAVVLAVPAWHHWNETVPPPPAALRLTLSALDDLTVGGGPDHPFGLALAPDGRRIAFPAAREGTAQLWLRHLTTGEAVPLPGTEGALMPFWSPDGQQIGFFADGRLNALTVASGTVAALADAPAPRGGVWHPDGSIVFAPGDDGLREWRADRGETRQVTAVDRAQGETAHRFPALLRQAGREPRWDVVYLVLSSEATRAGLWTASGVRLTPSETSGVVVDDWLVYGRAGALFAQRVEWRDEDGQRPGLAGAAQFVAKPVGRSALGQLFATATPEAIVYGSPQPQLRDLRWRDRRDDTQGTLAAEVEAWDVRVAPQGGRVAVTQLDPQLGTFDVWVYDGGRLLPRRISQGIDVDEHAVWSPDATRLAWVQARRSIATRGAQAALPEQVLRHFDQPIRLWDWSPDGQWFVVGRNRPGTKDDLFAVSAGAGAAFRRAAPRPPQSVGSPAAVPGKPGQPQDMVPSPGEVPYAQSPFNEVQADISPDGRWIAYASDESGQPEIYVDSFPTPGHRARVSTGGGNEPRWGPGSNEVFFRRSRELHVATLSSSGERLEATGTARLFDAGGEIRAYDVTADGLKFLLNVPAPSAQPSPVALIVHWRSLLQ